MRTTACEDAEGRNLGEGVVPREGASSVRRDSPPLLGDGSGSHVDAGSFSASGPVSPECSDRGLTRPTADEQRRRGAKAKIQAHLLARPLRRFTLPELATIGGCMESAASARWREIARDWEGRREEIRPGLFVYWLTGYRAMPLAKRAQRDTEMDEIRARLERLERAASLPYVVPDEVEG